MMVTKPACDELYELRYDTALRAEKGSITVSANGREYTVPIAELRGYNVPSTLVISARFAKELGL